MLEILLENGKSERNEQWMNRAGTGTGKRPRVDNVFHNFKIDYASGMMVLS
jgi:hypothetical protein